MIYLKKFSKRSLVFVAFLILALKAHSQEVRFPDSEPGKMAKSYFEAFNAESDSDMQMFLVNNRTKEDLEKKSVAERMAQYAQVKGMVKKLQLKQVNTATPNELVVLAYSDPIQAWFQITFQLNDATPPKLQKFILQPTAAPSDTKEESFGEWHALNDLLNLAVYNYSIPGISMVSIKNGEINEVGYAGTRKLGQPDRIQPIDCFHLGSLTKSMTASIIGHLIEEKKLEPTNTLAELFPEVKMLPVYKTVSIKQLLQHRGGIQSYLDISSELEAELDKLPENSTRQRLGFVKRVLNEEPVSKPGAAMVYSNAGYTILAAIAEKVSGMSWEEQLVKYIFKPLKMFSAGIGWPNADGNNNAPYGYSGSLGNLTPQDDNYHLGAYIAPAGDVHASMNDLAKFALAHMNGLNGHDGFLKSKTIIMLHNPDKGSYSSGWIISRNKKGQEIHEHTGSAGTFMAYMIIIPELNEGYVIASNAGDVALDSIFRKIISTYREK